MKSKKPSSVVVSSGLVRLRDNWASSSSWYRGTGFTNNDDLAKSLREAKAETLESCSKNLSLCIEQLRKEIKKL